MRAKARVLACLDTTSIQKIAMGTAKHIMQFGAKDT